MARTKSSSSRVPAGQPPQSRKPLAARARRQIKASLAEQDPRTTKASQSDFKHSAEKSEAEGVRKVKLEATDTSQSIDNVPLIDFKGVEDAPEEVWEKMRPVITQIYVAKNLTLRQTMDVLEERTGFKASQKQYARHMKQWGLRKNVKRDKAPVSAQQPGSSLNFGAVLITPPWDDLESTKSASSSLSDEALADKLNLKAESDLDSDDYDSSDENESQNSYDDFVPKPKSIAGNGKAKFFDTETLPMSLNELGRKFENDRNFNKISSWLDGAEADDSGKSLQHILDRSNIPGPGLLIDDDDTDDFKSQEQAGTKLLSFLTRSDAADGDDVDEESTPFETLATDIPERTETTKLLSKHVSEEFYTARPWQDSHPINAPLGMRFQPATSNEAIAEFQQKARDLETGSRAATEGLSRETSPLGDASEVVEVGGDLRYPMQLPDQDNERDSSRVSRGEWIECLDASAKSQITSTVLDALRRARTSHFAYRQDTIPSNADMSETIEHIFQTIFHVDWSPSKFMESQFDKPWPLLRKVVSITGTRRYAQATSCSDYLQSFWSETGEGILQALETSLTTSEWRNSFISTNTLVGCREYASGLDFVVSGTDDKIAEVAAQLAWLAAALQPFTEEAGISLCVPSIEVSDSGRDFNIKVEKTSFPKLDGNIDGSCWHSLFRNPNIVCGYPIKARTEQQRGLEVAPNIMAALVGSKYVENFDDSIFIKGFSSMLVPTKKDGDVVMWHHCHKNNHNEYISFTDSSCLPVRDLSIAELPSARHIVGWCDHVVCYAGTTSAEFNVFKSNTKLVRNGQALHGCKLTTPSSVMSMGEDFALTKSQKTLAMSSTSLSNIYRSLARRYVVFYDVQSHRGWLVDGLTALLHHVLTSIKVDEENAHGSDDFQFKWDDFIDTPSKFEVGASRRFFGNKAYRTAKIMVNHDEANGDSVHETLFDRTIKIYHVLIKAFEYQKRAKTRVDLSRSKLEGWEFYDIVRHKPCMKARTQKLEAPGRGWVDSVRELDALVIYGKNFGELLQSYGHHTTVPSNKSILAARFSDIENIMREYGDPFVEPPQLTKSTIWLSPWNPLLTPNHRFSNPYIAWPRKLAIPDVWQHEDVFGHIPTTAGVFFGQYESLGWTWPATGNPVPNILANTTEDEEDSGSNASTEDTDIVDNITTPQVSTTPLDIGKSFGNSVNNGGSHHFGDKLQYNYHNHHYGPERPASAQLQANRWYPNNRLPLLLAPYSDTLDPTPLQDRKRASPFPSNGESSKRARTGLEELFNAQGGPPELSEDFYAAPPPAPPLPVDVLQRQTSFAHNRGNSQNNLGRNGFRAVGDRNPSLNETALVGASASPSLIHLLS